MNKIVTFLSMLLLVTGCQHFESTESTQSTASTQSTESTESTESIMMLEGSVTLRGDPAIGIPAGAILTTSLQDVSRMDVAATTISEQSYAISGDPPYRFELPYDPEVIKDRMTYGLDVRITANKRLIYISTEAINPFRESPLAIALSEVKRQSMGIKPNASATNVYWRTIDLFDVPVTNGDSNTREIHLKLQGDRASGFAGCNNFNGGFTISGEQISIGPLAATRMMCVEHMQQESQLFQALDMANRFLVHGDMLTLYSDQLAVARFEAVYLY